MWNGKKLEQSKYEVSAFFNVSFQYLSEPNDFQTILRIISSTIYNRIKGGADDGF